MECMVVVVLVDHLPILALDLPVSTVPFLFNATTVLVTPQTLSRTPRELGLSVVVVLLPQFPGLCLNLPMAFHIALNNGLPVSVVPNALVDAPLGLDLAMKFVVVQVAIHTLPVLPRHLPVSAIPLLLNPLAVTMAPDPLVRSPTECRLAVEMLVLPHPPSLALHLPVTLHILFNNAVSVTVMTDPLVRTPTLALLAMECMVVVVLLEDLPILALDLPVRTIPFLFNSLTVLVTSKTLV